MKLEITQSGTDTTGPFLPFKSAQQRLPKLPFLRAAAFFPGAATRFPNDCELDPCRICALEGPRCLGIGLRTAESYSGETQSKAAR